MVAPFRFLPALPCPPAFYAPYYGPVAAGFPSPAEEHMGEPLDLHALLVPRKAATFFLRASGSSMTGEGIHDRDLLVVDRSIRPRPGHIVVASVDGGFVVKTLARSASGEWSLLASNPSYNPIAISPDSDFQIFGVVTSVIHQFNLP